MKRLLGYLLLVFNATISFAGEIDNLPLYAPVPYEHSTKLSQSLKSAFLVKAGDIINLNVIEEVKKKIAPYKNDLADYFPKPGELDTFVNNVANEGKNNLFPDNKLTDAKLIRFYEHLGNKLIGGMFDKILNKEGITDKSRRDLWVGKLLIPFNRCIATSQNSQYDASHCVDALTAALIPNLGVGLVYELSKSKLAASMSVVEQEKFLNNQYNSFKICFSNKKPISADVKGCAVDAMKAGVLKIADQKFTSTITNKASSTEAAKKVKQAVWPAYYQCTNSVGKDLTSKIDLSTQFINCVDDLVANTGVLMVQDKVLTNPTIASNFSKAEVAKLSTEKMNSFKACFNDQVENNKRVDGLIDTDKCENTLTNEVIYKVVTKSLEQTAAGSFKGNNDLIVKIGNEGKASLDKCWNKHALDKEREDCLRKTIMSFAQIVAATKLETSIPADFKGKKDLIAYSLKELNSCLDGRLGLNISEDDHLTAKTDTCANKILKLVALEVASKSIEARALEQKMDKKEIAAIVDNFVHVKFKSCLGNSPTEIILDKCTTELTKNAALTLASSQFRASAKGKVSPAETESLLNTLVNKDFKNCIGNNTSDKNLNKCVADLTKAATRSVVLIYSKQQIKEQLNADSTPLALKPSEDHFMSCIDKPYPADKVSSSVDECTKNFSLEFAKALGTLKFNSLMTSVLGTQGFKEQKFVIYNILEKYNTCLENLKSFSIEQGLLNKLTICTDALQERGINFVTSTVDKWMGSEQKDAVTLMVKNSFANFIPCLAGFLPPTPYEEETGKQVDSFLKIAATLLAQYIDYSAEDAKKSLEDLIALLNMKANPVDKLEVINLFYKNGAFDQFLKSMVRGEVKLALEQTPEAELPKELRDALLDRENFDKIFASTDGRAIKDQVMNKILKPVLIQQASMKSPPMVAAMDSIKSTITKLLVNSPDFGDQILKISIQSKMNDLGGVTKFFAKALYGKNSLTWEKVRLSEKGILAENYIRENVMMPRFSGAKQSAEEQKRINTEAEKLVLAAVKHRE